MKNNLLLFTISLSSIVGFEQLANAQSTSGTKPRYKLSAPEDSSPTETTLDIDDGAFLGYAGARWGTRSIDGKWVTTSGLRGMWLLRETLAFGIDFTTLAGRHHPFKDKAREHITQNVVTWGLAVERIMNQRKEFNWHAGGTIGRGIATYNVDWPETLPGDLQDSKIFYYLAPEAGVRWNLTKYTRPFAMVSALVPFGAKGNAKIETNKLSGVSITVGINVGNFVL